MFGSRRRQRPAAAVEAAVEAPLDDVIRRMRPLPYDSLTRWGIVDEVSGLDPGEVLPVLRRLLESDRTDDRLIGVQLTGTYFSSLDEPYWDVDESHLPEECYELVPLLRRCCEPEEPPELIAAVLGPLSWLVPDRAVITRPLARHPDARVRACAVSLLDSATDDADFAIVVEALTDDPDPRVRRAAAETIESSHHGAYTADDLVDGRLPADKRAVYDRLWLVMRPFLRDRDARIRAAVLDLALDDWAAEAVDVARAEEKLLAELTDPNVDQSMVSLARSALRPSSKLFEGPKAHELLERLTALQDSDWPARTAVPDRYPDESARRVTLDEAVARGRRRVEGGRWRRR